MSRWAGLLGALAVLVGSMAFAALNGGQRVTLRLGFLTLYQVSITVVVFTSLITGMIAMLIANIASDRHVRRILRERLAVEQEEEQARIFVDRTQTSLFEGEPVASEVEPAATAGKPTEAEGAALDPIRREP